MRQKTKGKSTMQKFREFITFHLSSGPVDPKDHLDPKVQVGKKVVFIFNIHLQGPDDMVLNQSKSIKYLDGNHTYRQAHIATILASSLVVGYSATDLIVPFSENGPANYTFSLFSKLPTNYPPPTKKIKNNLFCPKIRGNPRIFDFRLFFEYFLIVWVVCW